MVAGLCFFLSARCHIFGAGLVGLLLAADAFSRGRRAVVAGVVVGLPVCWVVSQMTGSPAGSELAYGDSWERLQQFPDSFIPGPFWKTWPPLLVGVVGLVQGASTPRRAVAFAAFLFLVAAVVLPRDFMGWQFAGWRFLPVAVVVGWMFLRLPSSAAARAALVIIGASQLVWSAWFHLDQQARNRPLLEALNTLTPHPLFRFPIVRVNDDNPVYNMSPFLHMGQLVTMRTGGAIYYGHHINPVAHFLLLKDGPVLPTRNDMTPAHIPGAVGDANMKLMMTRAARFDGIAYWGYPEEAAWLRSVGYNIVAQEGGLIIADLVGCPLTINLKNVSSPVTVSVGYEDAGAPVHEFTLVPGSETTYSHQIEKFPCGRRWLSARGEAQQCERVKADGPTLECTLRARGEDPAQGK